MRHKLYILAFPLLAALSSCSGSGDKADAYGNFEVDELTVSSETAGKLIRFEAEEGHILKAGETVAIIDTTQLHLKRMQLEASMDAVKKKLPNEAAQLAVFDERIHKLNDEIERLTKLVEANAAPSKQLDDLKAELLVTQRQRSATASTLSTQTQGMLAELEPMRFQLMQLEDQIAKSYIQNPINGTVLTTMIKAGELAGPGRAIYNIASLDPIVLRAYVSEDLLNQVKLGSAVEVQTDGPEGEMIDHSGTVTWISSEAEFTPKIIQTRDERTTQVYAMKIEVPNDGSLKIGMPAEVYFE
ncbi:MAG: efflux RND transporter periplasmic adaptor subunit [Flavobacteriales bacterium]